MQSEQELFALGRLDLIAESTDTEAAHGDADDVLCELLAALGFTEVVRRYGLIDKWYA